MKVAIVKSGEYLDNRIARVLAENGINGDFVDKVDRLILNSYHGIIFSYENKIPNISKLLEQIVLEKRIHVVYITNTTSIGQFYNLYDDIYFNYVQEFKLDVVLSTILRHTNKYLREIKHYEYQLDKTKSELDLLKATNKAKRILIDKGFSEADAHRYIIDKSMELRMTKKKLVNLIIEQKIDI
jgi:response regulator NasT